MKTINFSEQELESMLMMYYDELAEAKQYVEQLQDIIKKLSGNPTNETYAKQPKQGKSKNVASKVVGEPKEPLKRGRKSQEKSVVEKKPTAKSVPEANKANTKALTKVTNKVTTPKVVVAKSKSVVKKAITKPVAAKVESVVTSLLNNAPKKEVKKIKEKSPEKKRIEEMLASSKLVKPVAKKPKVAAVKSAPVEVNIAPKA
jgi:hypothetical protein